MTNQINKERLYELAYFGVTATYKQRADMAFYRKLPSWTARDFIHLFNHLEPTADNFIPASCMKVYRLLLAQGSLSPREWIKFITIPPIQWDVQLGKTKKTDDAKRRAWSIAQAKAARKAGCLTRREAEIWLRREKIAEIRDGLLIPINEDFKAICLRTFHNNFYAIKNMHESA